MYTYLFIQVSKTGDWSFLMSISIYYIWVYIEAHCSDHLHTFLNFSLRKIQFPQPVSRDWDYREIWKPFRNLLSNRLKHSISRDSSIQFLEIQSQEKVWTSYSAPSFQYTSFEKRALSLLPQHHACSRVRAICSRTDAAAGVCLHEAADSRCQLVKLANKNTSITVYNYSEQDGLPANWKSHRTGMPD